MRYLFVIQGEGRGHMTQAISLAQLLRRNGHEVVEVLVGKCSNRQLPSFFVDKIGTEIVRYDSPALDYGRSGKRGNIFNSIMRNALPIAVRRWAKSLRIIADRIEETKPDMVINFYELLMGGAAFIHRLKVPIISIAHRFMLGHPDYEHGAKDPQGAWMMSAMNRFCSYGSFKILALSLYPLDPFIGEKIVVVPPLLRSELFELEAKKGDYILGYMLNPAYLDEVLKWKELNPTKKLHLFWDKADAPEEEEIREGLWLHRINDKKFIEYMAGSAGYVTTAGFESVCEAYYLGKPVMMIPAHIEQEINARDASSTGIGIVSNKFDISKLSDYIPSYSTSNKEFREWVQSAEQKFIKELETI